MMNTVTRVQFETVCILYNANTILLKKYESYYSLFSYE